MLNEEIDATECGEDATNNVRIILYIKRGKLIFVLINIKHTTYYPTPMFDAYTLIT